jgi:hypothetical protein
METCSVFKWKTETTCEFHVKDMIVYKSKDGPIKISFGDNPAQTFTKAEFKEFIENCIWIEENENNG